MKVLHIYSGNLFGGIERMLISMAGSAGSLQSSYALCFDGRLAERLREKAAPLHILPAARLRSPLVVLRARHALRRLLHRLPFDAVVCHSVWSYCLFASSVRRAGKSPILFLHDVPDARKLYYRWAWRRPPHLCLANSEFVASFARELRPRVRTEIVHPLVDPPPAPRAGEAGELRREFGVGVDDVLILQASRLESWKGHAHLLRALSQLREIAGWWAWIAGSPQRASEQEYFDGLRRMTDELGLANRVRFIGHRDDMARVMQACDVYCQPNEGPEPYGMAFVEALAHGKPVVAHDEGGVREIVTPDCGILCKKGSGEVTAALRTLITVPLARAAMGPAARRRGEELTSYAAFEARLLDAIASAPSR